MNGREVEWNEKQLKLAWVRPELPEIPMWVAGYGPKALAVAGRVGDGVIIQLADPVIIQWIMDTAREAAAEAGRDPSALKCIVCAPSHITDDIADAREQVRWFPAMVSNHVMDLIERYGYESEIPHELTEYVRVRKFYDYDEHSRVGAKHGEFVTDEICDRFCVLGNAEQATAKLKELEAVGVDQFNIYLMTHGQEEDPRRLRQATSSRSSRASRLAARDRLARDALATSSTAVRAVVFSRSRIGFTSTTSSEPASPGLGDELEREVRLAVGEPAAHRRPDARRDSGSSASMSSETWTKPRPETRSSASRTARSTPIRSISLIVNTRTPASRSSCRSPSSRCRSPSSATRFGSTAGSGQASLANAVAGEPECGRETPSRGRSRSGSSRAC